MTDPRQALIEWLTAALATGMDDPTAVETWMGSPPWLAKMLIAAGEKADPDYLAGLLGNSEDAAIGRAQVRERWAGGHYGVITWAEVETILNDAAISKAVSG